ncbi:MAG: SPOR domain-containing protein [Rhodanobacteraceae bacterium]
MANKRKQAIRSQRGWPGWVWLCLGLLLGVALAAFVFLGGHAPQLRNRNAPTPNPDANVSAPSEPGIADTDKTKKDYDFYSVLPEMEVVIPDSELSAKARKEGTQSPATGNSSAGSYLLQAGSFPDNNDAEAVKARLALMGFVARVQTVTINGKTWHRVRLGPYRSAASLEAAKQKLSAKGINAIALKENN